MTMSNLAAKMVSFFFGGDDLLSVKCVTAASLAIWWCFAFLELFQYVLFRNLFGACSVSLSQLYIWICTSSHCCSHLGTDLRFKTINLRHSHLLHGCSGYVTRELLCWFALAFFGESGVGLNHGRRIMGPHRWSDDARVGLRMERDRSPGFTPPTNSNTYSNGSETFDFGRQQQHQRGTDHVHGCWDDWEVKVARRQNSRWTKCSWHWWHRFDHRRSGQRLRRYTQSQDHASKIERALCSAQWDLKQDPNFQFYVIRRKLLVQLMENAMGSALPPETPLTNAQETLKRAKRAQRWSSAHSAAWLSSQAQDFVSVVPSKQTCRGNKRSKLNINSYEARDATSKTERNVCGHSRAWQQ